MASVGQRSRALDETKTALGADFPKLLVHRHDANRQSGELMLGPLTNVLTKRGFR